MATVEDSCETVDLEDIGQKKRALTSPSVPIVNVNKKRKVDKKVGDSEFTESDLLKSWKELLGNPPPRGETKVGKWQSSK